MSDLLPVRPLVELPDDVGANLARGGQDPKEIPPRRWSERVSEASRILPKHRGASVSAAWRTRRAAEQLLDRLEVESEGLGVCGVRACCPSRFFGSHPDANGRPGEGPALREEDVLHFGVQVDSVHAHLAADPAPLVAAERRLGVHAVGGVDAQNTGADAWPPGSLGRDRGSRSSRRARTRSHSRGGSASSSVSNGITHATGPKISSCATRHALSTSARTAGRR